jgi:hypothetical protein
VLDAGRAAGLGAMRLRRDPRQAGQGRGPRDAAGGLERALTFSGAKVSAPDGSPVKASKGGDTWIVEVNDYEHYRIPEAVISGG